jgi:hypothetical protein
MPPLFAKCPPLLRGENLQQPLFYFLFQFIELPVLVVGQVQLVSKVRGQHAAQLQGRRTDGGPWCFAGVLSSPSGGCEATVIVHATMAPRVRVPTPTRRTAVLLSFGPQVFRDRWRGRHRRADAGRPEG